MAMTQPRAPGETSDRDDRGPRDPVVAAELEPDFSAFYRRAWPGAVRLAGLLTQDARVAEDVAQEAFTRVYPQWSRVESPNAYLRAAIVNASKSWQARRHTERTKLPLVATAGTTALGCRPGTVKSLTSRALAALRKGIEQ